MPYKQGSAIEWSSDQIKGDKQTLAKLGTKSRFSRLQPLKAILGQSQAIAKPKLLRQLGSASIRLGLSGLWLSSHAVATLPPTMASIAIYGFSPHLWPKSEFADVGERGRRSAWRTYFRLLFIGWRCCAESSYALAAWVFLFVFTLVSVFL